MRFICSKHDLLSAISSTIHAVPSRSTMPLLEGIFIKAEEDRLVLSGYNMEMGITAAVAADVQETGEIVIDASLLNNVIRSLSDDIVSFEAGSDLLAIIQAGNSEFKLKGLDADSYPKLPVEDPSEAVHLPAALLSEMIRQTIFAASQDQQRPMFNAVLLNSQPHLLEMAAIDGYRLAVRREEAKEGQSFPTLYYLIPAVSLREAERLMRSASRTRPSSSNENGNSEDDGSSKEDMIKLYTTKNHLIFEFGNISLITRLMQGEFMKYSQVIPESSLTEVTLNRTALLSAVERALLMTPNLDRRYPVNMVLKDPETMSLASHTEIGNSYDEITVAQSGETFDIDFNPRYFVDALKVIEDDMIRVEFSGSSGPCLIKPVEGEQYVFLILPLRR